MASVTFAEPPTPGAPHLISHSPPPPPSPAPHQPQHPATTAAAAGYFSNGIRHLLPMLPPQQPQSQSHQHSPPLNGCGGPMRGLMPRLPDNVSLEACGSSSRILAWERQQQRFMPGGSSVKRSSPGVAGLLNTPMKQPKLDEEVGE